MESIQYFTKSSLKTKDLQMVLLNSGPSPKLGVDFTFPRKNNKNNPHLYYCAWGSHEHTTFATKQSPDFFRILGRFGKIVGRFQYWPN